MPRGVHATAMSFDAERPQLEDSLAETFDARPYASAMFQPHAGRADENNSSLLECGLDC